MLVPIKDNNNGKELRSSVQRLSACQSVLPLRGSSPQRSRKRMRGHMTGSFAGVGGCVGSHEDFKRVTNTIHFLGI